MEDIQKYIWGEEKGKNAILKRMAHAYKKQKRKEKIEKLQSNDNHWKGLS